MIFSSLHHFCEVEVEKKIFSLRDRLTHKTAGIDDVLENHHNCVIQICMSQSHTEFMGGGHFESLNLNSMKVVSMSQMVQGQ